MGSARSPIPNRSGEQARLAEQADLIAHSAPVGNVPEKPAGV
jgi:hypothetical protein